MESLYNAYQAYERRVIRGDYDTSPNKPLKRAAPREPLVAQLGDLLIYTGLKLKNQHAARKAIAWSPLIGSKP